MSQMYYLNETIELSKSKLEKEQGLYTESPKGCKYLSPPGIL